MKKTALIFVCLLIYGCPNAQTRFTQFFSSPLLINPANTGRFNKSYRIGGAFRKELNAQNHIYTQGHFFADIKILTSKLGENESLAVGISGLNEQSKSEGITNNYFSTSIAYQKNLDEEGKQQLGIGFQATLARNKLEKPVLVFEDILVSWLNAGYTDINPLLFQNANVNYAEFSVGLIYQGAVQLNNFYSIGFSIQHVNKPSKVFQGGKLDILPDYWAHIGWESNFKNNNNLYAALITKYTQNSLKDISAGVTYESRIKKFSQIAFGAWVKRNTIRGNTIAPLVGINFNEFKMAFSYDIYISSKNTSLRSASELSLIYTNAQSRKSFSENRFIKF